MRRVVLIPILVVCVLLAGLIFGPQATAQTYHFCRERQYLTPGQLEFALASVTVPDVRWSITFRTTNDSDSGLLNIVHNCAQEARVRLCTEDLMMGLLDPQSAVLGGAAGLWLGSRGSKDIYGDRRPGDGGGVLIGLLGAGVGVMAGGTVKLGICNKKIHEVYGGIGAKLDAETIRSVSSLDYSVFQKIVRQSKEKGLISEEEMIKLFGLTDQLVDKVR